MKIVDRKTFIAMPPGTVFSKYEPCVFGDLLIKGDSLPNDFCYQQIADAIDCSGSGDYEDKLFLSQETGSSLEMDFDCQGRDGCFDEGQLFAVWERGDVKALILRFQQAVEDSAPPAPPADQWSPEH